MSVEEKIEECRSEWLRKNKIFYIIVGIIFVIIDFLGYFTDNMLFFVGGVIFVAAAFLFLNYKINKYLGKRLDEIRVEALSENHN